MLDMMKGYLQLAAGLGEMSRRKAMEAARELVEGSPVAAMLPGLPGGGPVSADAVTAQVTAVADELMAIGRQNRRLITQLVRTETHAVLASLGVASEGERPATSALERQLRVLRQRVDDLERQLRERAGAAVTTTAGVVRRPGSVASWTSAPTDTPTAPSASTSRWAAATRKQGPATATGTTKSPVKKAAVKKAAVKKAAVKKAAVKKSAVKKAAVKKSAARTAGATRSSATKSTAANRGRQQGATP